MFTYNIFLIGFMGTGKSTIASCLAEMYNFKIAEMDEDIARKEGKSITGIFSEYGEEYFRNIETEYLKELQEMTNQIVSCGGGVVLREENVRLMKQSGKVVWLTASPEEILKRVKDDDSRPLLQGKKNVEAIAGLINQRRARYEKAADVMIHTDGKTAEEICVEVMNKLKNMKERE